MTLPGSLRIALADTVDPSETVTGSGASASLLRALESIVAEVVPVSGELPPRPGRLAHLASVATRLRPRDLGDVRGAAKRAHSAAQLGRPTIGARSRLVRRRLGAAGRLDAVVQRSSDLLLPSNYRVVTLEDSTVLQAQSYPWAHLRGLTEGDLRRYVERQRKVYDSAVACCCATHWVADSIVGSYGIPRERVFTVGLGQNHETSAEPPARDWSTPRYLFVGVDWKRKNGPAVLRAFARVREQHSEATLDIVGGHPPIEQPGVHTHGRLSLADDGDRERMAALYRQATVFVMPSLHEPAGIVYVEAGGVGVPSIGTSEGGATTMIGPGGIIVDPLEDEQIVAAMLTLADPDTARKLGELAYRHSTLFTARKVAERVVRAMAVPGLDTSGLADFL